MTTKSKSCTATDNLFASASFRDPAGFVYSGANGQILRQINKIAAEDYELFLNSGLYDVLAAKQKIVTHKEVANNLAANPVTCYKVLEPLKLGYISYPFEWSFSQLKDAALLTLSIQKIALKRGMSLKDASAYNIQFLNGRPIFIDTLSFEKYKTGKPWPAYSQFCQHFLAPLALMSYGDLRYSQLSRIYIDGVPLDLARRLLPLKARIKPGIGVHISWHGKLQRTKANTHKTPTHNLSLNGLTAIIDNLAKTVKGLKMPKQFTEWGNYYENTNYTARAADKKAQLLKQLTKDLNIKTALDLGGNNGTYSRVLNQLGIKTICADIDPMAVESNYIYAKNHKETLMLPLLIDLINPGGSLGWQNAERDSIDKRLNSDLVLALALVHHLAISNNLPLLEIAKYFAKLAPYLIIEFVPKSDSQVQKLLSTREDIFPNYNETGLLDAFSCYYNLVKSEKIAHSLRTLYLFKRK